MSLDNAASLLDAGADYLAVVNSLFAADNAAEVECRARAFVELIHS